MASSIRSSIALVLIVTNLAHAQGTQFVLQNNNDMTEVHEKYVAIVSLEHVTDTLRLAAADIIPGVLNEFQPVLGLSATWSSHAASLGNDISPSDLQSAPSVHLEKAEPENDLVENMTYVLALTDPDAPSHDNPKWSEVCHWIATGLSITTDASRLSDLEDVMEYKPPGPPPKTGKHRYVLVALVPANGTTSQLYLSKPKDRQRWGSDEKGHGVQAWAHDNGLVPVGELASTPGCNRGDRELMILQLPISSTLRTRNNKTINLA